jgi:hypothetical protein
MSHDGDARRFCGVCVKQVHDLSALTETEARTVLADESAKGRVCVRYKADAAGNIKFKPETVTAASVWRMTLAAAGMTLALLTGCTDTSPDRILADRCEYEVGPWSFSAARGEGTCPAVEPEPEHEIVGEIMIEPPTEPESVVSMGAAPPIEPVVEPVAEMGKIALPEPEIRAPEVPEREVKGEIEVMGDIARVEPAEPCDPAKDAGRSQI